MITPADANTLHGWEVLVVDDDPKALKLMEILLSSHGVKVHKAENGKEGLERAISLKPRLIITDLSMPVMDGWQMVTAIKQEPTLAGIPIIALTAHAMAGDREKAMAVGCHHYLTKPIWPARFVPDLMRLLLDMPDVKTALETPALPKSEEIETKL